MKIDSLVKIIICVCYSITWFVLFYYNIYRFLLEIWTISEYMIVTYHLNTSDLFDSIIDNAYLSSAQNICRSGYFPSSLHITSCYDLSPIEWRQKTTLILKYTRELNRVPSTSWFTLYTFLS